MSKFLNTFYARFAALALPLLCLAYLSYLNRAFHTDDALIYQRYIQNVLDGFGLVYNPGEKFNALTSPLYTYLATGFGVLIGETQTAVILLASLLMAGTLIIFSLNFARHSGWWGGIAGALVAACMPYFYMTYGMETPLFILMLGVCIYLFEKQAIFWLGIACALLLVTRSEGVFLILALALEHFRQRRPFPKLTDFIIPLLIIVLVFSFNKFYYGTFLAETGAAKIGQGQSGFWPPFTDTSYHAFWFFGNHVLFQYLAILMVAIGILSLRLSSLNIIAISFLIMYGVFYIALKIPNYHWYYAPYYIFGSFYIGAGVYWLWYNFRAAADKNFCYLGLGTVIIVFLLFTAYGLKITPVSPSFGRAHDIYKAVGLWLKDNTPADSKIALIEIGHVGFYSQRYIIDILGLVNHKNAEYIGEKKLSAWLDYYQPDYILSHDPPWPLEDSVKTVALQGDYVAPDNFHQPLFQILTRRSETSPQIWPYHIESTDAKLINENGLYGVFVHAPGEVRFDLPTGTYRITAEFGLLNDIQQYATTVADGVTFSVTAADKHYFSRHLAPSDVNQGIQHLSIDTVTMDGTSPLIFHTLSGENTAYDWSFWRNIKIQTTPN